MFHSNVYWIATALILLVLGGYLWYTRHPTVEAILGGKIALPAAEVEALETLLADAGVAPRAVRVVEVDPDIPCWWPDYRNRLDAKLRVYRQFGRFGDNCLGIDREQVVSLSLVNTRLADTTPLARLPALRHVQLRDGRIETLASVPKGCRWSHLILSQNTLTDLKPLAACTALTNLDVSFNRLTALPDLRRLDQLERLDARQNALTDVAGLAEHPSLTWIDLSANRLTHVDGLAGLPWLETLHLGSNALSSLKGLHNLPALRSLYAYANRLQEVEPEALAGLPALLHVNLDGNLLRSMPPGYTYTGRGLRPFVIHPEAGTTPKVEVNNTPLAEALTNQALAAHDSKQVHSVDQLPHGRGTTQRTTRRGRSSGGLLSDGLDYEGTIGSLSGTYSTSFSGLSRQISVQVTASVESGRLRVYLAGSQGGYYYAEAIPGKPIDMSGLLISGTNYFIYFESVGGTANGIRWTAKG